MLESMSLLWFKMCLFAHCSKSLIFNHLIKICWASPSICTTAPFPFNWVNFPILRENFVYNNFIKLKHKVAQTHPPRAIRFFCFWCILNILFYSFKLLPIVSFFTKRTCPHSFTSPRISKSYQSKIVFRKISHVD